VAIETLQEQPDLVLMGDGVEAAVVEALIARGAERVVLIGTKGHRDGVERLASWLGERAVGTFLTDRPQVPREVADAAAEVVRGCDADWVLAHGGGTPVGVAKAVALQVDVAVAAIPTTYAGSERTDIWGLSEGGRKTTGRDPRVRPRVVGYDPELVAGLPRELSLQSLLNALAHSVEALYAVRATAEAQQAAEASLGPLLQGMDGIAADPSDLSARAAATRGAWRASEALRGASMAVHHKLAHVLGGRGLPHAPTHAVLLPYTLAFNAPAAPRLMAALRQGWSTDDPAALLYDRMRDWGLAVSLRELGLGLEALPEVVEQVLAVPYDNPRSFGREEMATLVSDVWHGRRPSLSTRRGPPPGTSGPHGAMPVSLAGPPVAEARKVLLAVHGRGANADRFLADLQRRMGPAGEGVAIVAAQASGCTWYPKGFLADRADNQPWMDQSLAVVDALWQRLIEEGVDRACIVPVGFSQGACLLMTWLGSTSARPTRVLAFTGAHTPMPGHDFAAAQGCRVHMARSVHDPWLPGDAFAATVAAVTRAGGVVDAEQVPGDAHAIHPGDDAALRAAVAR